MKSTATRAFLEGFFENHGAKISSPGPHRLVVEAKPKLAKQLDARTLSFAFNVRGLQADPESELATVGNPVFDRILELAIASGPSGIRYESGSAAKFDFATWQDRITLDETWTGFGKPFPSYTPVYCHVFRMHSSVDDASDEVEVVWVDGVTLQPLAQVPNLIEKWESLRTTPEKGRTVKSAFPVSEVILKQAIRTVEKRLRKRTARLHRAAEDRLTKDTQSIGEYYQGLIAEARSNRRKWAGGPAAREEKIRILQLDWRRRMEEARMFWLPKIEVSLVGVGVVERPRFAVPLSPAGPGGKPNAAVSHLFIDPESGDVSLAPDLVGVDFVAE